MPSEQSKPYKPRKRTCFTCDGRGKVRNNTSTPEGGYTFGFLHCTCCDGLGYLLSKQRVRVEK